MKDQYTYNLSNGKIINFKNEGDRWSWTVNYQGEVTGGDADTLNDAEDAVKATALSAEIEKLNDLLEKGLRGKPDDFFIDSFDPEFRYFAIVEAMFDDYENEEGLEDYNINYYSVHIEYGSREDESSWNFGDSESLGMGFEIAMKELKRLLPKIRAKKHLYS